MSDSTKKRWMNFWFEPQNPTDLCVSRALFFGALFFFYLPQDFASWGAVSEAYWMPIGIFRVLRIPAFSTEALEALQIVWKAALVLSCIGLFTRLSVFTSLILGFYLLGLPHNFGKTHHFDAPLIFIFGILFVSRCGDYWSADWLIKRRKNPLAANVESSGEYRWPVRAVWVTLALVFFAAGFAKLRHSGLEWVFSENMAAILIQHQYHVANDDPLTAWGLYIAQYGWLAVLLAGGALIMEVGYPLALFSRRLRWIFVPGMLLVLVGIRVLMGPTFEQFVICHLFWIPWGRLNCIIKKAPQRFATDRKVK